MDFPEKNGRGGNRLADHECITQHSAGVLAYKLACKLNPQLAMTRQYRDRIKIRHMSAHDEQFHLDAGYIEPYAILSRT